ncbi:hypothetical protein EVAR_57024_1 [Eumeta japonica]|uniref:Uncharacterized protein n=1 Tax=Eumeta variegata TaxID=151549 RepID=A0A4C2ADF7_EUMVA|nr:hypothetical protein EVAR_57024_1 [Eumeta japonica]
MGGGIIVGLLRLPLADTLSILLLSLEEHGPLSTYAQEGILLTHWFQPWNLLETTFRSGPDVLPVIVYTHVVAGDRGALRAHAVLRLAYCTL